MMYFHHQGAKSFYDMQFDHHPMNFHEVQIDYHGFFRQCHRRVIPAANRALENRETG